MLTLRHLIPPLTARTLAGDVVRAWDYKQKKSLLVAFLHAGCTQCAALAARIVARSAELIELDSAALVVSLEEPRWGVSAVAPVIFATDTAGRAAREYLGQDVFTSQGLSRVGLFVADRYGELFAQWEGRDAGDLPPLADALKWLAHTQIICEECGTPQWPSAG
jgi:hypothetical protein